jgi:hypothetical protein
MYMNFYLLRLAVLCCAMLTTPLLHAGDPPSPRGTAMNNDGSFNYQGYLEFEGEPANGDYYFRFSLFDSESDWLGAWWANSGLVTVTDGLFNIDIQMGDDPIVARQFWKDYGPLVKTMLIEVGEIEGIYTELSPRVNIGSTPHALHALNAEALTFPYYEFYENEFGDPEQLFSLQSLHGGTVMELGATADTNDPVLFVHSTSYLDDSIFGSNTGSVQVNSVYDGAGLLSVNGHYPVVGYHYNDLPSSGAAVLGQVSIESGDNVVAVHAINGSSGTTAALGTDSYAGDFSGDILARDNLRVRGEPTRDYATNSPSPIGPLAYGSVSSSGNVTAGTANLTAAWDAANLRYIVSVAGESMLFSTHSVAVTVVDTTEPRLATFNTFNGDLLVKIWDLNSGNIAVQDNFSIVIYDSNPTVLRAISAPPGADLDKYTERTGAHPVETEPKRVPVAPFEDYGNGITSED